MKPLENVCIFHFLNCVKSTEHVTYSLNNFLSVQDRNVNYRQSIAQRVSRTQSCATETYFFSTCDEERTFGIKGKCVHANSPKTMNVFQRINKTVRFARSKQQSIN